MDEKGMRRCDFVPVIRLFASSKTLWVIDASASCTPFKTPAG